MDTTTLDTLVRTEGRPRLRWLTVWTYFLFVYTILAYGLIAALIFSASTGNESSRKLWPISTAILGTLGLLSAVLATGLRRRRLWAWRANWIALALFTGVFASLFARNDTGVFLFYLVVLGATWGSANFIYFRRRRLLFR
jgi:hypothetical protein